MDNKRLIFGTTIAFALILLWQFVAVPLIDRAHPEWKAIRDAEKQSTPAPGSTPATGPATDAAGATNPSTTGPSTSVATTGPTITAAPPPVRLAEPKSPQVSGKSVGLGSGVEKKDARYAMRLDLRPTGAGIEQVILNDFKKEARSAEPYVFEQPLPDRANTAPLGTRTLVVNGSTFDLSNVAWNVDRLDKDVAVFSVDFLDQDGPLLRVTKTFRLPDRKDDGLGFEIGLENEFQNLSKKPVTVKTVLSGPVVPPKETDRGPDRMVISGYVDGNLIDPATHAVEEFKPEKATIELLKNDQQLAWAGAASVYFNAIVLPEPVRGGSGKVDYLAKVTAEGDNLDAKEADNHAASIALETQDLKLSPDQRITLPFKAYLGPKKRGIIDTGIYARMPRRYDETLVIRGGFCGFLTFQWMINLLVALLSFFHMLLRDWGVAIIALVCIVRLALHPITKRSQISMSKMQKMGPEMERLKKKYADDKEALNKAMWQFQKEQGLTPILGCLPMFLQMPIWIALYSALQSTFELRQAPFLWFGRVHLSWIADLAKPDALVRFSHPLAPFGWVPSDIWLFGHLANIQLSMINLLPILMAGVFWLQQKYTPKPPAATPEQAQQQKMMQWMSLLFPIFLYNGPSGLNLYILTSTTMGIIEGKRIRDHIKEREEAEKAGKVFVDTKPTRAARRNRDGPEEPQPKRGGIMGWVAELQEKLEQARREQERRGKGKI